MNNKEILLYKPVHKELDAINVWLSFPYTYAIGMSSLGYTSLFKLLDENSKVNPERIFTDTAKTKINKNEVNLFGFSFSFEFDFLKIFEILENYNIPFSSKERDESYPLIFGGGNVLTANPEPFAEIFDFIIIGDGEKIMNEIIDVLYRNQESKQEKLIQLSKIEGVYVPQFYEFEYEDRGAIKSITPSSTIKKRTTENFSTCTYSPIITADTYFSGSMLIEITRGCPQKCGFCLASYLNLPTRYTPVDEIKNAIDIAIEKTGRAGLLGALIAAHPKFEEICEYLRELRAQKEFEISISSLRADKISPKVVKMLAECGQKSTTIAIEAGSERLRKVINKNLSEEQILNSIKTVRENGLKGIKIYGMIGLPTETDEDIDELITLMKKIKNENKNFNITLSISSFVPKAQTPFQFIGREANKSLEKKNNKLKKELHKMGIKFKPTSIKWDFIQGVLSRGDRRLFPILTRVYKHGGSLGSWNRSLKEINDNIQGFEWYACRNIKAEELLPWELINAGIEKKKLFKEMKKLIN